MMNQQPKFSSYALRAMLVLALSGLAISLKNLAIAQPQPRTVPTGVDQPSSDSTSYSGQVEHYLLNPQGLVSGLILNNGLQVRFPPHNANSLVATIKPGDSVKVTGTPGTPSNFGQEVKAYSITNTNTQRTVINQPPADVNYNNLSVEGTARHWLVGRRGEINGILLSSGAQVMFPHHTSFQLFNRAKEGVSVKAQGFGTSNSYGQILTATSLTIDGKTLQTYNQAPPPHKLRGGRAGRGLGRLPAYGLPSPAPAYSLAPAPPANGQSTGGSSTETRSSTRADSNTRANAS